MKRTNVNLTNFVKNKVHPHFLNVKITRMAIQRLFFINVPL